MVLWLVVCNLFFFLLLFCLIFIFFFIMSGKVCLVTGASSGIGRAFVIRLDSLGYKVCLLGRRRDKLEEVKSLLTAAGEEEEVLVNSTQCTHSPPLISLEMTLSCDFL